MNHNVSIYIHPDTERKLTNYRNSPSQGILLTGPKGVGLGTIAKDLAKKDIIALIEPTIPKKEIVDAETGTISIEAIRRLYDQTRGKQSRNQFVVIDNAERMSHGAQGALLKLLEEPSQRIHFILTSHSPELLLPTIHSRLQVIPVQPLTRDQSASILNELDLQDQTKRTQLQYIADGLPAEMQRLLSNQEYFASQSKIMTDVKTLITGSAYQKLLVINRYHKDKSLTLALLDKTMLVLKRSVASNPTSDTIKQLNSVLGIREKISANRNARLQLMLFVL